MSGGSYDYMSHEMECGETGKFARHAESFERDLVDLLRRVRNGEITGGERIPGTHSIKQVPYQHVAEAEIALPAVIARIQHARDLLGKLSEVLHELAPVAHTLDRWKSSDDSADTMADDCIDWMRTKLGLPKLPPRYG